MIPKIIHFCWFGNTEIPREYKKYIHTWKKYCPDYKIVCWNEKNYDIHKNKFMEQAYKAKKWGFVPDYARLDIIYRYGGIYLDTDVEMLRNIDELLNNKAFAGMEYGDCIAFGLGFGAEKGHPLIKKLRDRYDELNFEMTNKEVNILASPRVQTDQLRLMYNKKFVSNRKYDFEDLTIYPVDYFCPEDYRNGVVNRKEQNYLWHHYSGSWLPAKRRVANNLAKLIYKVTKDSSLSESIIYYSKKQKK